jgi:hypothetical protein
MCTMSGTFNDDVYRCRAESRGDLDFQGVFTILSWIKRSQATSTVPPHKSLAVFGSPTLTDSIIMASIGTFYADHSVFNTVGGDQISYNIYPLPVAG